jgi:hypothetical protein
MKKITFLVASLVIMVNTTIAQEQNGKRGYSQNYENNNYAIDYRDAEPIVFTERGIDFLVFPNGDFDFNTTNNNRPRNGYYYGRREDIDNSRNLITDRNRGIRIIRDYNGRVTRVGNVFINYDYYGRVKRIGSIYMTYNSFALTSIGGLRIFYNHHGEIVWVSGSVNGYRNSYNPCPAGYHYNGNNNNYSDDDDDFYYYKKDGSKSKMDKEEIKAIKKEYKEVEKEFKKENK